MKTEEPRRECLHGPASVALSLVALWNVELASAKPQNTLRAMAAVVLQGTRGVTGGNLPGTIRAMVYVCEPPSTVISSSQEDAITLTKP